MSDILQIFKKGDDIISLSKNGIIREWLVKKVENPVCPVMHTTRDPNKPKHIFMIRHGERADFRPDLQINYPLPFDPPLTPDGLVQGLNTGKNLQSYLQKFYKGQPLNI